MLSLEPQWIAVYTNPRAEKKVEQYLHKQAIESYLPLRRELHAWSDRKKWVEIPLLTSYVFARITKKQVATVQSIPGVAFLVRFDGDVAVIHDDEIAMLREVVDSARQLYVYNLSQLHCGQRVRITKGPMAGWSGVLLSDCENGNFAVEIKGISMAVVMEMDQDLLEIENSI